MEYPNGFKSGLPNCAIVAIASLTGAHYNDVWEWFRKRNKRPGQWRGRTFHSDYLPALRELGATSSLKFHTLVSPIPLHYWSNIYSKRYPESKFLIRSSGHVLAIKDGIVLDQHKIASAKDHPSKGRRIKDAWLVE